ncbi:MAG TPA: hypothetical protein VJV79_04450 [Polyangiaceae bacterium]|nr:hypothetical protein [Polyangiaceae bacterium]
MARKKTAVTRSAPDYDAGARGLRCARRSGEARFGWGGERFAYRDLLGHRAPDR